MGGYSTCLFEAMAFHKKIIIIDIPIVRKYFPADVGVWVKSAIELEMLDRDNWNTIDSSQLWADGFEEKVKQRLKGYTK